MVDISNTVPRYFGKVTHTTQRGTFHIDNIDIIIQARSARRFNDAVAAPDKSFETIIKY